MSTYYCPQCTYGIISGSIVDPRLCNLSGSFPAYNLFDKYQKHVLNCGYYNVNSVFTDANFDLTSPIPYTEYENYCLQTSCSGSLEIDDSGRQNLVWYANKPTGELTISGSAVGHCDGVKLVLCTSEFTMHAYPTSSVVLFTETCACCGHPLV